jgi:serine/threonine protein phosphatase PrpC
MRIDLGPLIELRPRDTLVAATDGLFDNLTLEEIVHIVRKGELLQSTGRLVAHCRERMSGTSEGPCKPDDLTVIVFRPRKR